MPKRMNGRSRPAVAPYVLSHLLIGRGYGSFDPLKYRILDNQMLGWLVETGVIGVLAYAGMMAGAIVSVARVARKGIGPARRLMQAVVAVSAGFFVSNFLYDAFGFRQEVYIFFFVAALGVAYVSDPTAPQSVGEEDPSATVTSPLNAYLAGGIHRPRRRRTTGTVRSRILRSSQIDQFAP